MPIVISMGNNRIYFKRSKYLINKNKENLKPEELIKLETMLGKAKDLGYAYMNCGRLLPLYVDHWKL